MSVHPLTPSETSPASSKLAPGHPILAPILAIDYGRRRIGLALSDALGLTARPLAVCTRVNRRSDLARLRDICKRHNVGKVLVGWPLHLDGSAGEMAQETQRFAERLRSELRLPVELVDERLTTWEAHQSQALQPEKSATRRRSAAGRSRKTMDDVAAAVILTDYLSRAGRGSQE